MPKVINKVTKVAYPCTREQMEQMKNNVMIAHLFIYEDVEEPEEVTRMKSTEPASASRGRRKRNAPKT